MTTARAAATGRLVEVVVSLVYCLAVTAFLFANLALNPLVVVRSAAACGPPAPAAAA